MTEAWMGVIGVVVGTLITAGIQEYRSWTERKERYRMMTFQKRLEVHQEAYRLCMDVGQLVNDLNEKGQQIIPRFSQLHAEAREWLKRNCLYLDTHSNQAFLNAFFAASICGRDYVEQRPTMNQALEYARSEIRKCLGSIAEGVGAKYLPEVGGGDKAING